MAELATIRTSSADRFDANELTAGLGKSWNKRRLPGKKKRSTTIDYAAKAPLPPSYQWISAWLCVNGAILSPFVLQVRIQLGEQT